ncbi:MAG: outer membrane protein assembly factor BamD [Rhizobiales bacterium]|nr:outer membrane protein assembly factor BamD [Hyphomicrobiales bacterium]
MRHSRSASRFETIKPISGLRLCAVLIAGLAIAGCSGVENKLDDFFGNDAAAPPSASDTGSFEDTTPVGTLYNKGLDHMKVGEYKKAAKQFDEVERLHPYSTWATRATLMVSYAHYQRNAYADAINAAERFIQLHPGNKDVAYAYYLRGLSYYEQIGDTERDQSNTRKALESLEEVSRRFPESRYARDAEAKAVLARDHLAGTEMRVGRYYLKRYAYVAAINRFKKVVEDYQTTSHTPEALLRLTEAYFALGIRSEAQTAAALLGHNFPNSQWYNDAYRLLRTGGLEPQVNNESWLAKTWRNATGSG